MRQHTTSAQQSWGTVADWYEDHLQGDDTYHAKVILPNLTRIVGVGAGKATLDIACGQGYFTRMLAGAGYAATGADIAPELIAHAKKNIQGAQFVAAPAEKLPFKDGEFDLALCVLALQNIKDLAGAVKEAARVVKVGGSYIIVLNHPAFRVPKYSAWGWDAEHTVQYRRVDRYLSESHADIDMHPGTQSSAHTLSFHRPLQVYVKALAKAGFAVVGLEEWDSHRKSEKGPRQAAEDRARKEFPLFLMLHARRLA
jgi:ubiquinone/menaquinone biosynthesis C-methylase UbiE